MLTGVKVLQAFVFAEGAIEKRLKIVSVTILMHKSFSMAGDVNLCIC